MLAAVADTFRRTAILGGASTTEAAVVAAAALLNRIIYLITYIKKIEIFILK